MIQRSPFLEETTDGRAVGSHETTEVVRLPVVNHLYTTDLFTYLLTHSEQFIGTETSKNSGPVDLYTP